jgi:hypothetical protein
VVADDEAQVMSNLTNWLAMNTERPNQLVGDEVNAEHK